jgi:DNA-binding NtrC family response regulator
LDLQVEYGDLGASGAFAAADANYGLRFALPAIRSQFGHDETDPGKNWTRYPVVVISGLPKERLDEDVRRAGARGMISKQIGPSEARKQLSAYLNAHGLVPDPRGLLSGRSLTMLNTLAAARRAATSRSSVLLLGESGTGKELLARYTHDYSPRASKRYGVYHAAGRGDELQEDELFGHWAGAFTGADRDQAGLLEELNTGTVFIDEVGDIGPRVQGALMRPLQERQTARIGRPRSHDLRSTTLDLKFVFATNKDLDEAVVNGKFRGDLLQRISETVIQLPALRSRPEDIPLIAQRLLRQIEDDLDTPGSPTCRHYFDDAALNYLRRLEFRDGNVRELRSRILHAVLAHASEPRLTQTDFSRGGDTTVEESTGIKPVPSVGAFPKTRLAQIDALRRWILDGPEGIPFGEMREIVSTLRGSAPGLIVVLIEVAVAAARLDGRASLVRIVSEFWGSPPRTPQDARRALARLLAADWHGGSVLDGAAASRHLSEERLQRLIAQMVAERNRNGS